MASTVPDLTQKAEELSRQYHIVLKELTENLGGVSSLTLDHVLLYEAASEELQVSALGYAMVYFCNRNMHGYCSTQSLKACKRATTC
jgi:hypothetical protein